jgi:pimeloyl-ACP methyl ester carboxylesterase
MTTTELATGPTIHYVRRGEGEPLLLIQGMSGSHLAWGEPFLANLERDFDVVAYDHRGVGHSSPVTDPFSIADLADDAAALIDALGWDSAHVVGISMGGMVAQELALRHPQRIRTLTLGCTYCGGEGSALASSQVSAKLAEAMMSGDPERAIATAYEVNVSPGYGADKSAYATFYEMATALPVPVPVIVLQMQAIQAHDTLDRLGEIRAPTLVIHGTVDEMLPYSNAVLIASRIPDAHLETLDDVGHMFWWEQPERSAEAIRALVQRSREAAPRLA